MLQAMTMHESAQAKPVTNGTDCELLRRYAQVGDAAAFSALVERHAEMVHATCLRVLGETQDAEDAGQAVFLLLTRKARALPKGTVLAGWLYRTATFVAREARGKRRTRRRHEREAQAMRTQATSAVLPDAEQAQVWEQLRSTLDAELAALPATQRDALVLRYLQGRSLEDAAQEMNCPAGTLAVRASRGLEQLRVRLTQRGVVLPSALLSTVLMVHAVPTAPAGFAASVQAACLGKAGASVGSLALVEAVMKAWFWIKVKVALCVTALVLVGGMGVPTAYLALAEEKPLEATPPEFEGKSSPQPGPDQSGAPIWKKAVDLIEPRIVDSIPYAMEGSLLHVDGRLYGFIRQPEKKTLLVCLDALTGHEKWSLWIPQMDSCAPSPLCLENDRLVFKGPDRVFCVDAQKGTLQWSSRGHLTEHPFYFKQGVVVYAYEIVQEIDGSWTNDQGICAVEIASGRELWKKERRLKKGLNNSLFLVGTAGSLGLIKDGGLKMAALNLQTGEEVWAYAPGQEKPDSAQRYLNVYGGVEDPQSFFCIAEEGQWDPEFTKTLSASHALLCLDHRGQLAWKKEQPQPCLAVIRDQDDKRLFVSEGTRIVVLSKLDGARVWSDEKYVPPNGTSYCIDPIETMKVLGNCLLTIRGRQNPGKSGDRSIDIQCHDPETGRFKWEVPFIAPEKSSRSLPRLAQDGKIYLASNAGVQCLNLANGRMDRIAPPSDTHPVVTQGLLIGTQLDGVWAVKRP